MPTTSTDLRRLEWSISDDIIRFRKWGTKEIYNIPQHLTECLIGSSSSCTIRIADSRVSAQHARLMRDREQWSVADLSSKNGVRIDGVRQSTARLEPCMELGLGRHTLIAESVRSIELRGLLARLLGWGPEAMGKVDLALREIRTAQSRRVPFVLQGDCKLYSVARDLHAYLHGREAPFIVCDPRRNEFNGSVRSPLNVHNWKLALIEARGGTLCIPNSHPPRPFETFLTMVAEECTPAVQVIVCSSPSQDLCIKGASPIEIPSLSSRTPEQVEHVIVEYAADAARLLGASKPLSAEARAWVLASGACEGSPLSLDLISKAVLRLTAFYLGRSIYAAASRLGMSRVSLEKWFSLRPRPPEVSAEQAPALTSTQAKGEA